MPVSSPITGRLWLTSLGILFLFIGCYFWTITEVILTAKALKEPRPISREVGQAYLAALSTNRGYSLMLSFFGCLGAVVGFQIMGSINGSRNGWLTIGGLIASVAVLLVIAVDMAFEQRLDRLGSLVSVLSHAGGPMFCFIPNVFLLLLLRRIAHQLGRQEVKSFVVVTLTLGGLGALVLLCGVGWRLSLPAPNLNRIEQLHPQHNLVGLVLLCSYVVLAIVELLSLGLVYYTGRQLDSAVELTRPARRAPSADVRRRATQVGAEDDEADTRRPRRLERQPPSNPWDRGRRKPNRDDDEDEEV